MKKIGKGIGNRIKKTRKASRLNQADFGGKVGVTAQYVWALEKGIRSPSQALVIAIGAVFSENKKAGEVLADYLRTGRKG